MKYSIALVGLCSVLASCNDVKNIANRAVDIAEEPIGKLIDFVPEIEDKIEDMQLYTLENGQKLLSAVSGAAMSYDPSLSDALTTVGDCAHLIVQCSNPPEHSLDDCFRSVRQCTTDTPWEEDKACCPAACYNEYSQQRRSGVEPYPAFDSVLFQNKTCVPGLASLLEEG